MDKIDFFSADYRDGRVTVGGKTYPAGTFATHLLNQYYDDDTASRIVVFRNTIWKIRTTLQKGYLNADLLEKAESDIQYILKILPRLSPFDRMDLESERDRIKRLFTKEVGEFIVEYFRAKSYVLAMDDASIRYDALPSEYDEEEYQYAEILLDNIQNTLQFYDRLGDDIMDAHDALTTFTERLDSAERLDESHLLPIALEVCGDMKLEMSTDYVAVKKNASSKGAVTARRMYFDNYFSFVMTDFFEGLHHNHYPRECPICGRFFMMTSARRQQYCNGYAPVFLKGRKITCRKYAARMSEKERSVDNPITVIYRNRTSVIRVERSRGKITREFADIALRLAKEKWQMAKFDDEYAQNKYAHDMARDNLYNETAKKVKEHEIRG